MTTATATRAGRSVGDIVSIDDARYPGNWKIEGFTPKNVTLSPVGGGRGLRCPAFMLKDAVEQPAPGSVGVPFVPVARPEGLMMGAIITVKYEPLKGAPAGTVYYVVTGDKWDTVQVVVLGGNPGRPDGYWTRVPVSRIERVVPLAEVLKG